MSKASSPFPIKIPAQFSEQFHPAFENVWIGSSILDTEFEVLESIQMEIFRSQLEERALEHRKETTGKYVFMSGQGDLKTGVLNQMGFRSIYKSTKIVSKILYLYVCIFLR